MSDLENSDPMIEITSIKRSKASEKLVDSFKQNFLFFMGIITGACGLVSFYYTDQIAREKTIYATIASHGDSDDDRFNKIKEEQFNFERRLIRIEAKLDDLI